jgi:hypothetical protein
MALHLVAIIDHDGLRHLRRYKDRRKKPHPGDGRGGLSLPRGLSSGFAEKAMAAPDPRTLVNRVSAVLIHVAGAAVR